MKYKPTKTPIAQALTKSKEYGWAIVSAVIELSLISNTGDDYWCCGNTACGTPIRFRGGSIPKVCAKCGNEIDWVGIKTRVIKVCPTCSKIGAINDQFCDLHVPAVRLVNMEVPL